MMEKVAEVISRIDGFVWGPAMLVLMVGTGVFLTIKTGFLTWRNLGYALRETFSRQARQTSGEGDISSFLRLQLRLPLQSVQEILSAYRQLWLQADREL